ncbi:MAG: hypothetical protein V7677_17615 [Motiliproteus sp.]
MSHVVYIDMDDTICHFREAFEDAIVKNPAIQYPQSQFGFFEALVPIDGALEAIRWMIADPRFDPYILTAPSILNPWCYTGKRVWIEQQLGIDFCNRLIISPVKNLLKGRYLIDDCHEGKGQERFEGELIHYGSRRFPDWNAVRTFLDQSVSK